MSRLHQKPVLDLTIALKIDEESREYIRFLLRRDKIFARKEIEKLKSMLLKYFLQPLGASGF